MKELSVKECLLAGWKTVTARPWIFVAAGIIIFVASLLSDVPRSFTKDLTGLESLLNLLAFILSAVVSFLIAMGKTAFFLRGHDSLESLRLSDLWHPRPFWKFVGTSILAGGATIIGLLLFIIPGIIIGIIVGFSLYIVIDKELAPIDAIRESAKITKGNRWNLFLLGLAIFGINIVGFCLLLVGLFITLPISAIAVVHAYRVLSGTLATSSPASAAETPAVSAAPSEE